MVVSPPAINQTAIVLDLRRILSVWIGHDGSAEIGFCLCQRLLSKGEETENKEGLFQKGAFGGFPQELQVIGLGFFPSIELGT